jgi:hypothetical protein
MNWHTIQPNCPTGGFTFYTQKMLAKSKFMLCSYLRVNDYVSTSRYLCTIYYNMLKHDTLCLGNHHP